MVWMNSVSMPLPQVAKLAPQRMPVAEVVVIGVVDLGVEAEIALEPQQPQLGGVGGFFLQGGVADIEGAGGVVGAVGEELERGGRALNALHRGAGDHPGRQVLEYLEADARRRETERLQ